MIKYVALEGYKPSELIKTNETSVETNIFNFGVILLELLTGKEPNEKPNPNQDFKSNSMLDHRIFGPVDEEDILKLYRLAMACSPLPSFRPDIKCICKKLQEIES
ncbi:PTI1-like tyrosine-protein kinase 2 [Bidens hawaiensis]|uniref:PTI1-like tyrosine-protein kinase 2 n=1 Tax=Bidens hawaiensis TaxID=980011 RepID=UPI00404B4A1D